MQRMQQRSKPERQMLLFFFYYYCSLIHSLFKVNDIYLLCVFVFDFVLVSISWPLDALNQCDACLPSVICVHIII